DLLRGAATTALPHLERADAALVDLDLPAYARGARAWRAQALVQVGRAAEALALLEPLFDGDGNPLPATLTPALIILAECHLALGRRDAAIQVLQRAMDAPHWSVDLRRCQPWALLLLGQATASGEPPDAAGAERHYHAGLALADEIG